MSDFRLNHTPAWLSVLTFAIVLVAVSPVRAQSSSEEEESRPAVLEAGAWALQFSVRDNFPDNSTIGSFRGSTISVRRHVSDSRAWEAGLSLNARVTVAEEDDSDSETTDKQNIALRTRYLAYPLLGGRAGGPVQLVVGAGPELSFRRNNQESRKDVGFGLGIGTTIGAEWFFSPNFSLLGYYESALQYRFREIDSETSVGGDLRRSQFDLSSGRVRFGLSVYF